MIDCSRTKNYFAEKQRMTKKHKLNHGGYACKLNCADCPLSHLNNGSTMLCSDFETLYPEKAIVIVQKWSDEHPQKTCLSKLLEYFPNVPLHVTGTPKDLCPYHLGLMSIDDCKNYKCVNCWNQPIPIEDGESK